MESGVLANFCNASNASFPFEYILNVHMQIKLKITSHFHECIVIRQDEGVSEESWQLTQSLQKQKKIAQEEKEKTGKTNCSH